MLDKMIKIFKNPYKATRLLSIIWNEKSVRVFGTFMFYMKVLLLGIKVGKNVECSGKILLVPWPDSEIVIGDNVQFVSDSKRCTASSLYAPVKLKTFSPTAKILIGKAVSLNGTSIVARSQTISIGESSIIAPNVVIMDSDFHAISKNSNRLMDPGFENDKPVSIGQNVWIGARAIILKGVVIGNNSIIGAGSIVTGNIPENVIAAGNPAKVIKSLH